LRAVIDTAADGIVCVDEKGRIESVNSAALKLLGYERDEVVGRNIVDLLPEQYRAKFGAALTYYFGSAMRGMIGRVAEVTGQRKDGSEFPIELAVSRLSFDDRTLYTAIIRDITDRKRIEKRVSEFYSTISHELRSPLSSIRGSLGLIEGGAIGDVPKDILELVQIAKRNCDRLIRLINDILDAKKIEAGKLQVKRLPLRADELVKNAIEVAKSIADEAGIELIVHNFPASEVLADPDRVVQVLTNLLSNAIKHSPESGTVEVYAAEAMNGEQYLRFCVRDHGQGIPSDQLDMLFSEFQQLDSSDSRKRGGTGLGLAISKSIVEQLDGQIGVENCPGHGATFWFELPLNR
jgi:PAS domain S-box-containing protein